MKTPSIDRPRTTSQHLHDQAAQRHPGLCHPDTPTEFDPANPDYRWQEQHDLAVYNGGASCPGMGGDRYEPDTLNKVDGDKAEFGSLTGLAAFIAAKSKSAKGKSGKGKAGASDWITYHGRHYFVGGGAAGPGGLPLAGKMGKTGRKSIKGGPGGSKGGDAIDKKLAKAGIHNPDANDRREQKVIDKHAKNTGEAVKEARKNVEDAKKTLKDHDDRKSAAKGKLDNLHGQLASVQAKKSAAQQVLKDHDAKVAAKKVKETPVAKAKAKASATIDKSKVKTKATPDNREMTPADYAKEHGITHSEASDHLRKLHQQGKVFGGSVGGTYSIPHDAPAPAARRTVKSSTPRTAHEQAIHDDAKTRGKSAMVVTSRPVYEAHKSTHPGNEGTTHHHVGGQKIASHRVTSDGRHEVAVRRSDGKVDIYRHKDKAGAKAHLESLVGSAIKSGTRHTAVVGNVLSKFDAGKHGLTAPHHRTTARVLGNGGHVKFSNVVFSDMHDMSLFMSS